jgi:O-antigen/teichoic acid export membrane protein
MKHELGTQLVESMRRGATVSLISRLSAKVAAFMMTLVLAQQMTVEGYGSFVLVVTWLLFLVMFGLMGIDTTALRFSAEFTDQDDGLERMGRLYPWALRRVFLTSSLIALIALALLLARKGRAADLNVLLVAALTLPLLAVAMLQQSLLRGMHKVGRADLVGQIFRPLSVVIFAVLFGIASLRIGTLQALVFFLLGSIVSVIAGSVWIRRAIGVSRFQPAMPEETQLWKKTATPMLLIAGSHFMLHQLDILMLGSMTGPGTVAPYAVASRLADLVAFPLLVASGFVAPMISSLYHSGRTDELRSVLRTVSIGVTLVSLVIAAIFAVWPSELLGIFGQEYAAARAVLLILVVGQVINGMAGPVGFLLSMTGHERTSAWILGGGVLLNVVLNFLLIPLYFEVGAAIATAITTVYWNLAMTLATTIRVGLRATPI